MNPADRPWWRSAVVYQIYPRSFADNNGDGVGDLAGVHSRVPYLQRLGIDAVWLSPFYPSALADGGYDVDDYRNVDPRLGTLDDFDAMAAALHDAGIRLLVDLVPNHTSNRHPWFLEALASPAGSPARCRYIFRNGSGPDRTDPPNDWKSLFGGSAWEPVGDGQHYLHLFAPEQPDLNWDHAEVRADFLCTIRFWADRGVDGFRVDAAHGLVKDLSEPFRPWSELATGNWTDGSHPLWDRDGVQQIYATWRELFDSYDPPRFGVAEAGVHASRRARYASAASLGQAFNFDMQDAAWDAADLRRVIDTGLADMRQTGSSATWLLGCHDSPRVATRYGLPMSATRTAQQTARDWLLSDGRQPPLNVALGVRRARAAAMTLLALPGSTYIYQGDELGLPEVGDLPEGVLQDPIAHRPHRTEKGRDGCRVPLPWNPDGPSLGFGGAAPHLPQPPAFAQYAVSGQDADPSSTLSLYRRATALRRKLSAHTDDGFAWLRHPHPDVLHFVRPQGWHCLTNLSNETVELPDGLILLQSQSTRSNRHELPPDTAAWIQVGSVR
jgi:alpha-glucosidase